MPVAPATIVRTNRSCPGTSTSESRAPVGQLERRVAEIDRDAAPPAPRAAGRCPFRSTPARATSCRGRCGRRCRRSAACSAVTLPRHGRPRRATARLPRRSSVRQSSSRRPSRTTPTTGGSPRRSGAASASSTAHAKLGSSASGSAPPPTRATVSSTSPPTSAASRSARARTAPTGSRSIRSTGISRARARGRGRARASPRARRASACRRAARAGADGGAAARRAPPGRRRSPPAGRRAACRRRSRRDRRPRRGSPRGDGSSSKLDERAGAEVVDERQPVACATSASSLQRRSLGEADDAEVRLVHAQDQRRVSGPIARS